VSSLPQLTGELAELFRILPGPVASMSLRLGDYAIEVTWATAPPAGFSPAAGPAPPAYAADQAQAPAAPDPGHGHGDLQDVLAPLVGTFYVAPEPGAGPFVQVGDQVKEGQALGIVEAMKLMNPIDSPQAGEVIAVLAGDGEPVEFGQPLVRLRVGQP
jgi:acetyl-CoA carboxylase biotin carboxyl carrier protein